MNAFDFLTSPVADALGWTLLHAIWQGFALVLPVAVLLHLLRSQASALRYHVSVATLLVQLLVSGVTFIWYYQPVSLNQPIAPHALVRYATQVNWQTVTQSLPWHQQTQLFLEAHLPQFVLIYLLGVSLFGLRLAGGWLYLQQLSKTARQPAATGWTQLANRLRTALSIRLVVQVRESARISGPMVVGIFKPIVLLPIGLATSLSMREIEAVIAHELAHIKRHDYAVNLLQSIVEVLYFFHPALWWLSARVREEREHCCDDLAVAVCGGDGRVLAQALARVEELRLTQLQQAPVLAMSFAANRQHLLHRVQRVLGIPTRPFVSNSSLTGLTLATILFMSVSVYAVQKQDKPKPKQPKPMQSTRSHKVDRNSAYSMVDSKRVGYIVWKGKKLPAEQVARLQRQLDQIMAGKLSLDALKQADRDILLTIIEKNNAFDEGIEGLSHIDYNNIVVNAINEIKVINYDSIVNSVVQEVKTIDYNRIVHEAMASVDTNIVYVDGGTTKSGNMDAVQRFHQRKMDSLSRLLAQRSDQMQALHLQMEKLRFPVEEADRQNQVLEWQKQKLMEQRNTLIEKHQKLLYNSDKQKLNQAEVEKQLSALEPEIKKQEMAVDELNNKLQDTQARLKATQQPIGKMEQEAEELEEQIEKLSNEIGRHGDGMARLMPVRPPLPPMNRVNARSPRAPRPMRTPRPVLAPTPPVQATPAIPGVPPHAEATPGIPAPPARVTTPPSKPKPALAPKPPKPGQ